MVGYLHDYYLKRLIIFSIELIETIKNAHIIVFISFAFQGAKIDISD